MKNRIQGQFSFGYIINITIIFLLLTLISCSENHERMKNFQISISRNASQINRDLQHYLNIVYEIAQFTEHLYNEQDNIILESEIDRFILHPSGAMISRVNKEHSAVFVSGFYPISPEILRIVNMTESLDNVFRANIESISELTQIYFAEKHSYIRIFPSIDVLSFYQIGTDITNYNFYYLANESFNPSRVPLFIDDLHYDNIDNSWIISVIAPVYHYDEMQGVVGLDISVNSIYFRRILDTNTNEVSAFLMNNNGFLVVGDENIMDLFELSRDFEHYYEIFEKHNLLIHDNLDVQNIINRLLDGNKNFIVNIENSMYYVLCADIPLLNWYLVYLIRNT
ncbi:MAG: hypothetical protein FWG98_06610 [Candidatus Cloacimonetes bacterium]|nr:hypothetical protein [Candidatus Cloacimonadota bacterium]